MRKPRFPKFTIPRIKWRRKYKQDSVMQIVGVISIVIGVALVSIPASFIAFGLISTAYGSWVETRDRYAPLSRRHDDSGEF
jgi:hypothetical protein